MLQSISGGVLPVSQGLKSLLSGLLLCCSNTPVPWDRVAASRKLYSFSAICSSFSATLVTLAFFERFAPVSLKHSSFFRAVCSCFLNAQIPFERFAVLLLTYSSPFRAVCSCLLKTLSTTFRASCTFFLECSSPFCEACSSFSKKLVPFTWFAPVPRVLLSLSSGFAFVSTYSSHLRAVCSRF